MTMLLLVAGCKRTNPEFGLDSGGPGAGTQDLTAVIGDSRVTQQDSKPKVSSPVCGDGKCDKGEDHKSCSKDCKPECAGDATKCLGKESMRYCVSGVWQESTCKKLCVTLGYQYAAECKHDKDKKKDLCLCGNFRKFGDLCDEEEVKCGPGLFCAVFEDDDDEGFCTKYCSPSGSVCTGAPKGTLAMCSLISSGKPACGFSCNLTLCPSGMSCDKKTNLCKPK